MNTYKFSAWIDWSHYNGKMIFTVKANSKEEAEQQAESYCEEMKIEYLDCPQADNEFGVIEAVWDIELNPEPVKTQMEVIEYID